MSQLKHFNGQDLWIFHADLSNEYKGEIWDQDHVVFEQKPQERL